MWAIVSGLVFTGTTVIWVAFDEAVGLVGLAVAGVTLHEIEQWRAEHQLPQLRGLSRPAESRKPSLAA